MVTSNIGRLARRTHCPEPTGLKPTAVGLAGHEDEAHSPPGIHGKCADHENATLPVAFFRQRGTMGGLRRGGDGLATETNDGIDFLRTFRVVILSPFNEQHRLLPPVRSDRLPAAPERWQSGRMHRS